jgi:DDE superfamily endonuclease
MAPFDAAQEKRIAEAIKCHHQNPGIPKKKVAVKYTVDYHAFLRRLCGVPPGNSRGGQSARLSSAEDAGLKKYLSFLTRIGMPPSKRDVTFAANHILESQGKKRVSKDWPRRWLHRNKNLYKSLKSKTLANERKRSHQIEDLQRHFNDFEHMLEEYHIQQADVWNFDEIGFRIGCLKGRVVIVPADVKAIYLADPDNRESITVLECISGGGESIAPFILMKGEILMEKHFMNRLDNNIMIGATLTGFTNDVRTYQWLQHFDKLTKERAEGRYRALVMDGHGSHVSDHFKHYCWRNKIVPFLLLPHSTHLLQPLDVGVFSAMKAHHQNSLYESIRFGDFTFDRTDFLDAFQEIHDSTMRPRTIYSGWAKTGLFPFNPEVVLSKMRQFDGFSAIHASQALASLANSKGAAR